MASAVESPLLFSLRVSPALAQPQPALRLLAGRQVDHRRLALSVVRLALRPDRDRQAAWLEVYGRQVAHALFRLAPRRDLHRQVACQVGRSWVVVLALLRRDAHAHLGRLEVVFRRAGSRALYPGLALACSEARQGAPRLELRLGACLLMAGHVPAAVKLGNLAKSLRAIHLQPGWLWPQV